MAKLVVAHLGDILLGIVGPRSEMRGSRDKTLLHRVDPPLERAVVPGESGARGLFPTRGDQLHDGFRLREAELSVQEGTAGKLTRLGGTGSGGIQRPERPAKQISPPVAGELRDVLARKAGGARG